MKKATRILIILIGLLALSSFYSYSQSLEKKCIVFLVNRISLEDIENMPFTKKIADEGAIGLMNTRAYGSNNEYSSSLTIGCGTRAAASYYTSRAEKLNEENISIYHRRTGYTVESQKIANLDIAGLKEINKKNNYNPIIGALGNSLKMNNVKISVIGNSDTEERKTRLGVLMGMDEYGLVDLGLVEKDVNIKAPEYPFSIRTNYDFMIRGYNDLSKKTNFIIFELGDLHRLEKYKGNLAPEMYVKQRRIILNDIDLFIKNVYNLINQENTRILVLSPTPSSEASSYGKRLTPIILAGENVNDGILSSDTTRREGIVGNIDIAPYIAAYFKGNTNYFTGKSLYVLQKENKFTYIKELNNDTAFIYENRFKVLFSFAIYEIIVSFLAFIVIQAVGKYKFKVHWILEYFLLSNMAIPIALLVLPLIKPSSIYEAVFKIIIITVIITIISIYLRKETIDSIIFLSGLMCLLLMTDIMLGSKLIKMSFLGYDPIIGARYYGIGNEYMGIFVGSSLVFITALMNKYKLNKGFSIVAFIIITLLIGFPKFGANVGGTITAAFSFMFVILRFYNTKLKITHYIYIISSVCALIVLIALADLYLLKSESHLANAIKQINNGGMDVVLSIIKRKISMNIKLFGVTIWSKVLISSLIFLSVLFYRPFGIAKKVFNKYDNLSIGLLGILISCIVSFLVNDSGVVASATSIIFLAMTLMYLVFNEINTRV